MAGALSFSDMGLDDRLLEAISDLKWKEPTLIQEKAIPLALEGKDILARARTGSGKTAAFVIPILQFILDKKKTSAEKEMAALILAPSKELCKQIRQNVEQLCKYCSRDLTCVDVSPQVDLAAQRPLLLEKPDIVIGTPLRVLGHFAEGNLQASSSFRFLVIDEADLLLSYGCERDMAKILAYLPSIYQAFLMSATLSPDVAAIKKLVLHNPAILKLEEPDLPESDKLTQYHIKCEEEDKFVLIYALLKLKLIQGKSIIFVNSVDRCYRLKLFLEQFGIKSCVLNAELPASCRCHAVSQFNSDVYDIIIASDETVAEEPGTVKRPKKVKKDKEYSLSRGIDFQFVTNVINFDFPESVEAYVHRVGRTARGNASGTALSFISSKEEPLLKMVEQFLEDGSKDIHLQPYLFKMEELEGFKYRAQDAYRAVTKVAVREARLKEIKAEVMNSCNLKPYFEDNPRDLQVLRHDKPMHTVKLDSHLKNVPDYIVPPTLKNIAFSSNKKKKMRPKAKIRRTNKKFTKKQQDPLKSFQFAGLTDLESRKRKK